MLCLPAPILQIPPPASPSYERRGNHDATLTLQSNQSNGSLIILPPPSCLQPHLQLAEVLPVVVIGEQRQTGGVEQTLGRLRGDGIWENRGGGAALLSVQAQRPASQLLSSK